MTYEIPARILREVLGNDTPLSGITREAVENLCSLLRKAPQNAAQRYKGKTSSPKHINVRSKRSDQ